jgi:hypothetical protein
MVICGFNIVGAEIDICTKNKNDTQTKNTTRKKEIFLKFENFKSIFRQKSTSTISGEFLCENFWGISLKKLAKNPDCAHSPYFFIALSHSLLVHLFSFYP